MAKTTAILLTRATEKDPWKLEFRDNQHEAYTEYKKLYIEGKVDAELWTSSQGRIAKIHQSAPKINPEAIKPIDQQEGTEDFKTSKVKAAKRAEQLTAAKEIESRQQTQTEERRKSRRAAAKAQEDAQAKEQEELDLVRDRRIENSARAELATKSNTELAEIITGINIGKRTDDKGFVKSASGSKKDLINAILTARGIKIVAPEDQQESADEEDLSEMEEPKTETAAQ